MNGVLVILIVGVDDISEKSMVVVVVLEEVFFNVEIVVFVGEELMVFVGEIFC